MPLLFLCARHGRASYQVQDRSGQTRTLKRSLPEKSWLKERAKKHSLCHLYRNQEPRNLAGSPVGENAGARPRQVTGMISIAGLVSVAKGKVGQGVLTAWTPEEEFLCEFLGEGPHSLHDFCSLQVERAVAFRRTVQAHCPQRFTSDLWAPSKMTYPELLHSSGLTRQELESGLQMDAGLVSVFLEQPLFLRVPLLPLDLLFKRDWCALMLKGSDFASGPRAQLAGQASLQKLQVELGDFPPQVWIRQAVQMKKNAPAAKHDQEDLRFQAVHAQQLSQFLRQWSGHILGEIEEAEG